MKGRRSRPLSEGERAILARNHPQSRKPTWGICLASENSRLMSARLMTEIDPKTTWISSKKKT